MISPIIPNVLYIILKHKKGSQNICAILNQNKYEPIRKHNMSLTIPNLVPQRPFCYLNFISAAKPQKFGNETYDAHVLASSKTYRKQNKPKKWISNPLRYMSF